MNSCCPMKYVDRENMENFTLPTFGGSILIFVIMPYVGSKLRSDRMGANAAFHFVRFLFYFF